MHDLLTACTRAWQPSTSSLQRNLPLPGCLACPPAPQLDSKSARAVEIEAEIGRQGAQYVEELNKASKFKDALKELESLGLSRARWHKAAAQMAAVHTESAVRIAAYSALEGSGVYPVHFNDPLALQKCASETLTLGYKCVGGPYGPGRAGRLWPTCPAHHYMHACAPFGATFTPGGVMGGGGGLRVWWGRG